jgi:transposase
LIERENVDTKSINLMTRQQVRSLAGKLMEEWQDIDAVAEALGCHPHNIRRWHAEYQQTVQESGHPAKEPGRPPKLTGSQQDIIQDIIFTKSPTDMDHDEALWSNKVIRDTISDLFRITLSLGTVNTLTQKMGIVRRNIFRENGSPSNSLIAAWLTDRFPVIRKLAKDQGARIFFIHEERIENGTKGGAGSVLCNAGNEGRHLHADIETRMLSAICSRNSQRFMIFRGPMEAVPTVAFLTGLMHDVDRPLFLIAEADLKPAALSADPFLASVADRLSLFFLPKNGTLSV